MTLRLLLLGQRDANIKSCFAFLSQVLIFQVIHRKWPYSAWVRWWSRGVTTSLTIGQNQVSDVIYSWRDMIVIHHTKPWLTTQVVVLNSVSSLVFLVVQESMANFTHLRPEEKRLRYNIERPGSAFHRPVTYPTLPMPRFHWCWGRYDDTIWKFCKYKKFLK